MLERIENHKRSITIIREDFGNFKVDAYFSSKFKITSSLVKKGLEDFYLNEISGITPHNKDVYIFCFCEYGNLGKLIDELEYEGHEDIKNQIFIFLLNEKYLK